MAGSVVTDPFLGSEFARFRVEGMLGEGPSGAVYLAKGNGTHEHVALKVLRAQLFTADASGEQWLDESRLLRSLNHPNIVGIHEVGFVDGHFFIVMDAAAGRDLYSLLSEEGVLEPKRAVDLLAQASRALDAARWARGIVHGNLKPSNVLISDDRATIGEHVRLTDFGLSQLHDVAGTPGTPAPTYLAPEQILEEPPNARSDIYALGCLLYECITGYTPFARDSHERLLNAHLHDQPLRPSRRSSHLPPELDDVIGTAMAKAPDDRFSTSEQLIAAAREALAGKKTPKPFAPANRPVPRETISGSGHRDVNGRPAPTTQSIRPRVAWRSVVLLVLMVTVIGVIAGIDLIGGEQKRTTSEAPEPTTQPEPPPAPQQTESDVVAVPEPLLVAPGPSRMPHPASVFQLETDSLLRVDPATNLAEEAIEVGVGPAGVARADRAIWIANFGSGNLSKVNPTTREEVLTLEVNGSPTDVAYARGQAWAINGGLAPKVSRLANDRVVETIELPRPSPLSEIVLPSLVIGDGVLWATAPSGTPTGISLFRIDPETKEVAEIVGGLLPQSEVAFGSGSVWVGNLGEGVVARIDPDTLEVVAEIEIGEHIHGLAAGAGAVWVSVCTARRGFLARIDPARNQVRQIRGFKSCSFALEVGAGSVWLGSDETNRLLRISPLSGGIVGLIDLGGTPTDIDVARGWVWVTAQSDRYPPPEVFSTYVERQAATARRLLLDFRTQRPFRGQAGHRPP